MKKESVKKVMDFMMGMKYLLSTFVKIPMCLSGLSFFMGGGIGRSIQTLKSNSSHVDMRNSQMSLYDSWGISFWIGVLFSVIYLVITSISIGFLGIFTMAFGSILQIIGFVIGFLILSVFIALGMKYESAWNATLVKVLIVLSYINLVISCFGVVGSVIALFDSIGIVSILNVIQDILTIFVIAMGINALSSGTATNSGLNQNNFNQNNFNQNGFNQNGFNQNGFNQNGFGQNGFGQNSNSVNTEPLFNCPYCKGVVSRGQNPCPHCGQTMNWG